jgi:hypothetical protein
MSWKPSIKQLETIADMANARLPSHKIAKMLDIELEAFVQWGLRTIGAVEPPDLPPEADDWQPEQKQPSPKIVAERLFETSLD